ncbi:MAG: serine/threonine protein kinase [Deltaproteobacteria bacterium]|nr:serine/threonine protein kinase [Deltaproteobacteria bacterium]
MTDLRKFEILEMIAKGGMAEVYRAKTVGLEGFAKEVCVKKILPHLTADDQFVTMFINEAKLAATLNYGNIVHVYDLCVSADREYFIVMEYVHGKDLSDVIRAAQLAGREVPPAIAVYVARETCNGLHYAHTKTDPEGAPLNIIHRDVSPQNILISFMGEVKITDFGIAKASSIMNKTAVGILKGKYGYMSPEQARGEPLDARSDIFNLGILLYEMIVGERCFAGASDYSTLNLMREATVTPPSKINKNVPPELESIVMKALAKEPKNRWRDALELEGALAAFADKTKDVRSADVARFMQELFSNPEPKKGEHSTGVLSLSSVVGPPASPGVAAKHQLEGGGKNGAAKSAPSAPSAPPPPASAEPGAAALDRARKRAARDSGGGSGRSSEPPPKEPTPPKKERPAHAEKPPKVERAAKSEDAAPEEAPKERKLARLKPVAAEDAKEEKSKEKAKAAADKRPIARRDLRPGLTALIRQSRPARANRHVKAAVLIGLALIGGGLFGWRQHRSSSREGAFRALEVPERAKSERKKLVSILVTSQPPGAAVWLDKAKLVEKTPLSVERPRDDKNHEIELALDGHKTEKRSITYESGPITLISAKLEGEPGELVVNTRPSNLKVTIDGKEMGTSPLSVDVPQGDRLVEITGEGLEPFREVVRVVAKDKTTLDRTISRRGRITSAAFVTRPPLKVVIDGRDTGLVADGTAQPIEPGTKHRVRLFDDRRGVEKEIWIQQQEGEQRTYLLEVSGGPQTPKG